MTDSYFDKANRHELYLGRTATHLINEYPNKNLSKSYKDARAILVDFGDITSITKLNQVTAKVTAKIAPQTTEMFNELTSELNELAVNEAAFSAKMVGDVNDVVLVVPPPAKVIKTVNKTLITLTSGNTVNSGVWAEYTRNNTASLIKTYNNQIRAGYSNSETLNQITKRLRTVTNGILKNQAEALVRTGVSHYATQAREVMAAENGDIIHNKYFNSVFDNRRTLICSHFAANPVYSVDDKKAPVLPLHFNERSTWLYLIGDQKHPFGTRPAVGGKDTEIAAERYDRRVNALNKRRNNPDIDGKTSSKVKYRGRKDGDTFKAGQIAGDTGASQWLRDQPRWFIESSLGKTRADLFISGRVKLEGFTDMTGKKLTIKELYASGV